MKRVILVLASAGALAACTSAAIDHAGDTHSGHAHVHGEGCGHDMIAHGDHYDYLHDGHLHHAHGDHYDEHVIDVSETNPAGEAPVDAALHAGHAHGESDGEHPMVRHGDHMDFIHDGRLHHVHGDHVDDHGPVELVANS